MPEPLLKILARFDINEKPEQPLGGRAYLSAFGTHAWDQLATIVNHTPDLVYAVNTFREVIASPALKLARKYGYKHAVAIMWGETRQGGEANQMIDLLLWEFKRWEENGEIRTIALKNGSIINPRSDGSLQVTCEGGSDILIAEKYHRRLQNEFVFKKLGPEISSLNLEYDFCTPEGRERLNEILQQKSHPIHI
ncbi:hypothetical protein J4218_04755 [Candidatus Pacearchaeota archaeon]|nr:hypothetical protein [Candidatus Pacearchaeota archaeon]